MSLPSVARAPFARFLQSPVTRQTQTRCLHHLHPRPIRQNRPFRKSYARNGTQQIRNASTFSEGAEKIFKEYPIAITFATISILLGSFGVMYANYRYQTYIIAAFHKYPEPVAQKLRRAIYFTNEDLQPKEAIKYYRQALQIAEEMGMDPFSDEIMGVKIRVAALMERIQQYSKAIQVLEILRRDSLAWIEQLGGLEQNRKKRTEVLSKCVRISVKLGELYGQPVIYNREVAEERLVWAVETVLKERQRRDTQKISEEDEGPWMNDEEIGAAMESLAHTYEEKNQHYLATPLFLQALSLVKQGSCHSVILMNNLASSLAQQSPRAARAAQAFAESRNISAQPAGPTVTRETMIENARTWAQKAIDVAANIKPPVRDEECDVGCAVAAHNLGEFAEMQKDVKEAERRYEEAVSLSRAIGFQEGVENSSERLRLLKQSG